MDSLQLRLRTVSLHLFFAPVRQTGTTIHNNDFGNVFCFPNAPQGDIPLGIALQLSQRPASLAVV